MTNKLDGNAVERIDVVHFLESLEFSRTHPYTFHIQTEDIERFTSLSGGTTANDRWKILRKLVGTEEFLRSKSQAQRILFETENEIRSIDSLLRKINGQFDIFVANETPIAYDKLSKRKQTLEQCHRTKQSAAILESISKSNAEIDRLEAACAQHERSIAADDVQASQNRQKKLQLDQQIASENAKRRNLLASIGETQRIRDMLSERVTNCRSRLQADELLVSFAECEKSTVTQSLEEKQHDLRVLAVEYTRLTERSNELCQRMVPLEQCCQQLMLNAAQNARMNWKFCTESDRNAWIDAEFVSLAKEIKRKESQVKRTNTEFETKQRLFAEKKTQLKEMNAKHEEYGPIQEDDLDDNVQRLNRTRDAALKSKQLSRIDEFLNHSFMHLSSHSRLILDEIDKQNALRQQIAASCQEIENELMGIIGKVCVAIHSLTISSILTFSIDSHGQQSLFRGLKSMETILQSDKCPGELCDKYHGLIIDRLKRDNNYDDPAVGVLAGPRLFHHIVADVATATQFIRLFNENHSPGEIFFVTLDDIKMAGDVESLLGINTATPPDPFFGEHHDAFISCIPTYHERTHLTDMQSACALELVTLDYKLDRLNRSIEVNEHDLHLSLDLRERFKRDMVEMRLMSDVLDDIELKMKAKATIKAKYVDELNRMVQRKLQLESERKIALLTPDEQVAVDGARRKLDVIAEKYRQNVLAMNETRSRRNNLDKFIETYLKRKQRELDEVSVSYASQTELLERDSSELDDSNATLHESEAELTALNETIDGLNRESAALGAELQQHRKRKKDAFAEVNSNVQEKIRLMAERDLLNAALAKCGGDVVTAMPAFDESIAALTVAEVIVDLLCPFSRRNSNFLSNLQLEEELDEVNHQLAVFKETNRFDVDRVENFKNEKQRLNQRLAELKKNGNKLSRLIGSMDVENGNDTRETMNRLQASFAYLFHRIIDSSDCAGHLELRPAGNSPNENEEIQELEIYCTFFSDEEGIANEMPFDQLSRNQKSIVAFIFTLAVLQSCPYTIYLLEHIDEVMAFFFRIFRIIC